MITQVALLVYILVPLVYSTQIRGGDPQYDYTGTTFTCDNGMSIPMHYVNDDYCDCSDGTDEPGTSACANGYFYCENKGHVAIKIPSSMVDDGICDCCDGTDEPGTSACEDICGVIARRDVQQIEVRIDGVKKGLEVKEERLKEAKEVMLEKEKQRLEKEELVPRLNIELDELKEKRDEAKRVLEVKEQELDTVLRPLVVKEIEVILAEREAQKGLEDNKSEQIETDDQDEAQEERDDKTDEDAPDEDKLVKEKIEEDEERNALKKILDDLENQVKDSQSQIKRVEKERDELNKFMEQDYGPNSIFSSWAGKTYELKTDKYTYSLKAFDVVKQDSVKLGKWGSFEDNFTKMKFESGDKCWNGPVRSIEFTLLCGSEEEILDVKEPNKCEYTALFHTPIACYSSELKELEASYAQKLKALQ